MTDQSKSLTVTNFDKIKALARNKDTLARLSEMLGSKQWAQSYIASALLVVSNDAKLMECSPSSIFNSVMRAAALRLSCDPATKQAYIVPFYNSKKQCTEAQFIPGYVGINQMAHRTGKYRVLNTAPLYEGRIIEIDELTGEPRIFGTRTGERIQGYFHYFELFNGFKHVLYMTVEQLREHGEKYAPKNPKWKTDFDAMARKTVTRLHLLRDGILDPFDRTMLEEEREDIDGEIIERDAVDGSFTEKDDETAAAEAAAHKEAEARKPQPSEAEVMRSLGFEDHTPAVPAPASAQPAPAEPAADKPWTSTKVSRETAETLAGSDKVLYWSMSTEALADRHGWILNSIAKNHLSPEKKADLEMRRDTIAAIIEWRKSA